MKNVISEGDWIVSTIEPQEWKDKSVRILRPTAGVMANNTIVSLCGDGFRNENEYEKQQVWSNARLIAAAPDLLEACYEYLFSHDDASMIMCLSNEQKHAVKLMRAAVKKAML